MSAAPDALRRLSLAQPQLTAVHSAREALGLDPRELLHAGPPLRDPRRPSPVLLSSAVMAILHERWADTEEEAEVMVAAGEVTLSPAQPRGAVTPLACVVSPGMPLFEVEVDGLRVHAPVSAVRGPDTRMGWRDASLAARLRERDEHTAPAFRELLLSKGAVALAPLAAHGLRHGDDLHSRTTAATAALAQEVRTRRAQPLADALDATPLFFLSLWMAASAAMLRTAEGGDVPTLVTRAGGNGERFGVALAADPHTWICADAQPPQGPRLDGRAGVELCPAIGDSAVIDVLGCGGLALAGAPEPLQAFAAHLPPDHADFAGKLLSVRHEGLGRPVGLDARAVVSHRCPPIVALAMLAADGRGGLAGRGVYRPPLSLFESALVTA